MKSIATQESSSSTHLRVCCYGSSNKNTKQKYIDEAYALGLHLGKRGHTCVNGAGATGSMGAMNQGVLDAHGTVVGVIHEIFVDKSKGGQWLEGCHDVFRREKDEHTELIIVGGNDLQERKRMLVKDADALVVLPGGTGTFDELWEMACARQIGFVNMPIVCVNVDGFYDPFLEMLERAYQDEFLYKHPSEILHFENTSKDAIHYIEKYLAGEYPHGKEWKKKPIKRKPSMIQRMMSTYNLPFLSITASESELESTNIGDEDGNRYLSHVITLLGGIAIGMMINVKSKGNS